MDRDAVIRLLTGFGARLIAKGLTVWLAIDAATAQSDAAQIAQALAALAMVGVELYQTHHVQKLAKADAAAK